MLLRGSLTKKFPKKKRLNFSAILSKEYFNNNIIQIQMALNKNRILPLDYFIRKTKSKINTGITLRPKKNDDSISDSYRNHLDKRKIPEEIEKILAENEKKFLVQSREYFELKNDNDKSLGYWHYVQEMNKKKNQENFFKKLSENNDTNAINLYSDKIREMSQTMFKANPLLITKEKIDIFFYYLGEFNKYYFDKEKYARIKKKVIIFLKNLKDFLDYVEIKADSSIDSIGKEIKLRNSKFIKRLNNRIKAELKTMKIKEKKLNKREIKSSQEMIRKTKKTLESLHKEKNFFEDPVYFDPNYSLKNNLIYKSRTRNRPQKNNKFNLSAPNFAKDINTYNMNQIVKMTTASTGFFVPEKKRERNIKMIPKAESCKNRENIIIEDSNINFKKIKINRNLINKRITSALNFPNNKIILKANSIKYKKSRNISVNKTENIKKTSEKNDISSSMYNNNIEPRKTRKIFYNKLNKQNSINSFKKSEDDNIKNIKFIFSPENAKNAKSGGTPMVKINKNILKKKTFNNIQTSNYFKFNNTNHSDINIRLRNKRQKSTIKSPNRLSYKNINSNEFSSNDKTKSKLHLSALYEGIKSKHKLNYFDTKDIETFFTQNGKKIRNNLRLMDIISQVKQSMHKYDIEQKTKKISQSNLTSEQNDKLIQLKDINNQIEMLHIYYMNNIFDCKSRTMCESNQIKV